MISKSEMRRIKLSDIKMHGTLYPRKEVNLARAIHYADAMTMGTVFPPVAVATCYGEYVLVDGAHRLKALGLLGKSSGEVVDVEYLGNMEESEVLDESIRRNRANGLPFNDKDLYNIVMNYKGRNKDMRYLSGLLQTPLGKLTRIAPSGLNYPRKISTSSVGVVHVLHGDEGRKGRSGESSSQVVTKETLASDLLARLNRLEQKDINEGVFSAMLRQLSERIDLLTGVGKETSGNEPLGMTLDELIDWTRKFINKGDLDEGSVDLLTLLRDDINSFLEKKRKELKAAKISGQLSSSAEKKDGTIEKTAIDENLDPEQSGNDSRQLKRMVDAQTLAEAVKNSFEGISDEEMDQKLREENERLKENNKRWAELIDKKTREVIASEANVKKLENAIQEKDKEIKELKSSRQKGNEPNSQIRLPDVIDLEMREVEVTVRNEDPEVRSYSTRTVSGKIVYSLVNEIENHTGTFQEIQGSMRERGWNVLNNTLAPELGKLVKAGTLVKAGEKPERYRLPGKLKVEVAGA